MAIVGFFAIGAVGYYFVSHSDELFHSKASKATVLLSDSTDSDGDGISDKEERELGIDPYNVDTDSDGYTDNVEVIAGYDPLEIKSVEKVDSDGDGLNDEEEEKFGTSAYVADTDFDGTEDGREVIAGSDPLKADLSYFLQIAESQAKTEELEVMEEEDAEASEENNLDTGDEFDSFGGSDVITGEEEVAYSDLDMEQASGFTLNSSSVANIENTINSTDLDSLEQSVTDFIADSSLDLDVSSSTTEVEIPEVSDNEINIKENYTQDDVVRYASDASLMLSRDLPFSDTESFERYALSIRLHSKQDTGKVKKIMGDVLDRMKAMEVPDNERIIALHKKSIGFILASMGLLDQIEQVNFSDAEGLYAVTEVIPRVNYLAHDVFAGQIVPEMTAVINEFGLQDIVDTITVSK